jgi:hypothetical protein
MKCKVKMQTKDALNFRIQLRWWRTTMSFIARALLRIELILAENEYTGNLDPPN